MQRRINFSYLSIIVLLKNGKTIDFVEWIPSLTKYILYLSLELKRWKVGILKNDFSQILFIASNKIFHINSYWWWRFNVVKRKVLWRFFSSIRCYFVIHCLLNLNCIYCSIIELIWRAYMLNSFPYWFYYCYYCWIKLSVLIKPPLNWHNELNA